MPLRHHAGWMKQRLCCLDGDVMMPLQVLHVGRQLEVTRALHNVLERSFPEEYEARRQETLEAMETPRDQTASFPVPLFVMQCIMPGTGLRVWYQQFMPDRIMLTEYEERPDSVLAYSDRKSPDNMQGAGVWHFLELASVPKNNKEQAL